MPVADAARRFGVSRKTAYKWLKVFDLSPGAAASSMSDRSRRPASSPLRTADSIQDRALDLRDRRNWGARKIHFVLKRESPGILSIRTRSCILARNGRIKKPAPDVPPRRFDAWPHALSPDFSAILGR
jgi:transposase